MMRIKEIAKLVGVSPATVSRVMNQKNYVKPELRARVLAAVKETGYVPDSAARSVAMKRTFTVGIVIPDTFNMFQRQLFSSIERSLEGFGYRTIFFFVKREEDSEIKCLKRLTSEKLDGIIMIHEMKRTEFYDYLRLVGVPVVLCTFALEGFDFPSVHVDEFAGAVAATKHLIGLGHHNIGLISGRQFSFGSQRAAGYRSAMAASGLPVDERLIIHVPTYRPEDGRLAMYELMARSRRLSALFAATDELAIGALRALYEMGLKVPEDFSMVGFDDIDISAFLSPALTTVRQPIVAMGQKTAELMFQRIAGATEELRSTVFGYQLMVRKSSQACLLQ